MIEIAAGTIALKGGFGVITAVFKSVTTAAIKKYKDRKYLQIPSIYDLSPISEWYAEQLKTTFNDNEIDIDENLVKYLSSREFTAFLQYVFVYLFSGKPTADANELKLQFSRGLNSYGYDNAEDSETLYRILCSVSLKLYELAKVDDLEIPQEASSEANSIMSTTLLASIDDQLSRIASSVSPSVADLEQAINKYKVAVSRRYGKIQPQSFDGAPSFDVNDLYVVPTLSIKTGDHRETVEYHEVISNFGKSVVVGDPGGGKTTLSQKVACDLARGDIEIDGISGKIIPFVIILRDYGAYLKNEGGSILDYITKTSSSVYQVDLTKKFLESMLELGYLYVIFDGLDELLDTSYRKQIAGNIDVFSAVYPTASILVTSRIVGYSHNALDESIFTRVTLGEFNAEQVSQYVHNWFRLMNPSKTSVEQGELAKKFVDESDHAHDIRSNPLMLGLMCTIYRSESYIPRNRPDVYEKCSKMLFKSWDKNRNIGDPLHFEAHIDRAVASLASDIYENPDMQSGVDERTLVDISSRYFSRWAYDSATEARAAAEEFVGMCKGRAWILAEAGLSPYDEPLFRFTHRTFLEYFTADHIWQQADGIDNLCDVLIPRIAAGELDVVAELSLQMAAKSKLGGADRIIERLSEAYSDPVYDNEKPIFISLVSRSLTFLVLSPKAISTYVPIFIKGLLRDYVGDLEDTKTYDYSIIAQLSKSVRESREQIRQAIAHSLVDLLEEQYVEVELLCAVAWDLPTVLDTQMSKWREQDSEPPADMQLLKNKFKDQLFANMKEWPWAGMALLYENLITPDELLSLHPTKAICGSTDINHLPKIYQNPSIYAASGVIEKLSKNPRLEPNRFNVDEALRIFANYARNNHPVKYDFTDNSAQVWGLFRYAMSEKFDLDPSARISTEQLNDIALLLAFNVLDVNTKNFTLPELKSPNPLPEQLVALWTVLRRRRSDNVGIQSAITDPLVISWSESQIDLTQNLRTQEVGESFIFNQEEE